MSVILEVEGVTKRFGKLTAVDGISFRVSAGEIVGFIGPNGAGKTTTMRICATLEQADAGDVRIGGKSVAIEVEEARRRMGFMPDHFGAYASTTVLEYLDFFARAHGLAGELRRRRLTSAVEFTGLGPLLHKELTGLSKGMRQRTCLAKTLLHDPELLILDEPASGLDPRARIEFRELLKALAGLGKAVLVSSHILSELSEVCTGAVVVEAGRLQAGGTLAEIFKEVHGTNTAFVRCLAPAERMAEFLTQQPGVDAVRLEAKGCAFEFQGNDQARARLLAALVTSGLEPIEFRAAETDLEDVFMHLTRGELR
jgi:ABC-2 type transport system ATP-binding protein